MKFLPLGVTEKYRIEICFVNLMILFYLFRTAIPVFKYPFLLLYFSFIVYSLINYKTRIISTLKEFINNYYLILILALILVISFLLSNKLYLMIFKDVVNMVILLSIFFISTIVVSVKKELKFYVSNLVYLIVVFAFVISILRLLNLLNIYSYNDFSQSNNVSSSAFGDSISIDYNFALLPVFFGMIGVFYLLRKNNSKLQNVFLNILFIIFSLNIILSGSRRGLLLLLVIFLILAISVLSMIFKKNSFFKELGSNLRLPFLSLISITILLNLFFFHTSYKLKNKTLMCLGTKNIVFVKYTISLNLFRYVSVIDKKITFSEYYDRIWAVRFDPEDPDSGWGSRFHKTIFPLMGKNVEIVPQGVKGYLMDSTCNPSYYPEINLCESYTSVVNLNVRKGDRYKASVYCFVSENFDGSTVSFGNVFSSIAKVIVTGNTHTYYDLTSKGKWKKLEIEYDCNDGITSLVLSFTKKGVRGFSNLKGYVIFAYPQYEKINISNNGLSLSITQGENSNTKYGIIDLVKNEVDQKNNESSDQLEDLNHTNNSCLVSHDMVIHHDIMPSAILIPKSQTYFSSGIFCFPMSIFITSGIIQNDQDPVRDWASKLISEDTTYYPYKANIVLDTISNSFIGDRVLRWQFALKIFSKEYNWKQKIVGGDFNFLNWYGYYFQRDKTRSDYPHNPFLTILLYSGILGLIVYMIFMFKVFYFYIKYFKEYKILSVFFSLTFFFSFFSAGSPFDPPMMGFFVILPFFIHYIHRKNKPE